MKLDTGKTGSNPSRTGVVVFMNFFSLNFVELLFCKLEIIIAKKLKGDKMKKYIIIFKVGGESRQKSIWARRAQDAEKAFKALKPNACILGVIED